MVCGGLPMGINHLERGYAAHYFCSWPCTVKYKQPMENKKSLREANPFLVCQWSLNQAVKCYPASVKTPFLFLCGQNEDKGKSFEHRT